MTETELLDAIAALSGLTIPPADRDAVLRQWRLNQRLAAPLLAFALPDDLHPAPIFHP